MSQRANHQDLVKKLLTPRRWIFKRSARSSRSQASLTRGRAGGASADDAGVHSRMFSTASWPPLRIEACAAELKSSQRPRRGRRLDEGLVAKQPHVGPRTGAPLPCSRGSQARARAVCCNGYRCRDARQHVQNPRSCFGDRLSAYGVARGCLARCGGLPGSRAAPCAERAHAPRVLEPASPGATHNARLSPLGKRPD